MKTITIKEAHKKLAPSIGSMIAKPDDRSGHGALKDGYWVLLQDWTSCSVKCGNGTSYQQWMCVPPKGKGKPCVGKRVKTKECNSHACPSVSALLDLITASKKNAAEVSPRPIVKAGVFSNRPQRYSKCIIKENDAFIMTKVVGASKMVRKPMRIMMNNMTISIFNDDHYQELFYSFDLQKSKLIIAKEHCCFRLQDNWQTSKICGYNEYCGPKHANTWVDGWSADLKLFKNTCKTELQENSNMGFAGIITADIEDEIKKKSSEIMDEVNNIKN
jgi:hypothetical protein